MKWDHTRAYTLGQGCGWGNSLVIDKHKYKEIKILESGI